MSSWTYSDHPSGSASAPVGTAQLLAPVALFTKNVFPEFGSVCAVNPSGSAGLIGDRTGDDEGEVNPKAEAGAAAAAAVFAGDVDVGMASAATAAAGMSSIAVGMSSAVSAEGMTSCTLETASFAAEIALTEAGMSTLTATEGGALSFALEIALT